MLTFNKGLYSLAPLFKKLHVGGSEVGPHCTRYLVANDETRLRKVQAKVTAESKRRRKLRCEAEKAREEQLLADEGLTYQSGAF